MIRIRATAAATAATVPAVAVAATGVHPDRELVELGREYAKLVLKEEETYAHFNQRKDLYTSREPVPRDCMRHTIEDIFEHRLVPPDRSRAVAADLRYSDFYTDDEVAHLRLNTSQRSETAQSRADEIIAEWDRWQAECGALDEATGYSEAQEAAEALTDAMGEIQEAVITIAAKTVAGLQVRAAVMKRIFQNADEEYTDARLVRAMIRDIEAMSQRAPVA